MLPILEFKSELIQYVKNNDRLLVVGDTGSGKTSQLPQIIHSINRDARICCTQPRQLACISNSKRVAYEMKSRLGQLVGYQVRFDKKYCNKSKIVFMTDGIVLRLLAEDTFDFDYILLDECHERSLDTDILLGILLNKNIKLIAMSATVNVDKFKTYLNCAVYYVPGRPYPVEILFPSVHKKLHELENSYFDDSMKVVEFIHKKEPQGDILVFLTGQEEIERACLHVNNKFADLCAFPLFAGLDTFEQHSIFDAINKRKVVFSTNIAQTSVTIPNIKYVVDCGFSKEKVYDVDSGMGALVVLPISQSAADQRSGRAGRTSAGKTYRLYSKLLFDSMPKDSTPEIKQCSLLHVVLYLKQLNIDIETFKWMDPPQSKSIESALIQLYLLDALVVNNNDLSALSSSPLSRIGRLIAQFPLTPALSRVLIASADNYCSEDCLKIVSILASEDIYKMKTGVEDDRVLLARKPLRDASGDHLTYLTVFNEFVKSGKSKSWCFDYFINNKAMITAHRIYLQLCQIMEQNKLPIIRNVGNSSVILKSFLTAYFTNIAKKHGNQPMYYHYLSTTYPNYVPSGLVNKDALKSKEHLMSLYLNKQSNLNANGSANVVMYHDILYTSRATMICCSKVEMDWATKIIKIEDIYGVPEQKKEIPVKRKVVEDRDAIVSAAKNRYKQRKLKMTLD
eukprot:NODE_597_length_6263_cov_0.206035.p1 type:complete len:680 gc:universal NODE_597_length_6263_cov_0.206035:2531-492(-)